MLLWQDLWSFRQCFEDTVQVPYPGGFCAKQWFSRRYWLKLICHCKSLILQCSTALINVINAICAWIILLEAKDTPLTPVSRTVYSMLHHYNLLDVEKEPLFCRWGVWQQQESPLWLARETKLSGSGKKQIKAMRTTPFWYYSYYLNSHFGPADSATGSLTYWNSALTNRHI